jgi:hypothetical protein
MDINNEEKFLHQEISTIESYVKNFNLSPDDKKYYQKLVKSLSQILKLKTKINMLLEEKHLLNVLSEINSVVGIDDKKLREQWSKKNKQYLKNVKVYNDKKKKYEKL